VELCHCLLTNIIQVLHHRNFKKTESVTSKKYESQLIVMNPKLMGWLKMMVCVQVQQKISNLPGPGPAAKKCFATAQSSSTTELHPRATL
jgi:hypothetical protein